MFALILALIIMLVVTAFQLTEEKGLAQPERSQRFGMIVDVKAHDFGLW